MDNRLQDSTLEKILSETGTATLASLPSPYPPLSPRPLRAVPGILSLDTKIPHGDNRGTWLVHFRADHCSFVRLCPPSRRDILRAMAQILVFSEGRRSDSMIIYRRWLSMAIYGTQNYLETRQFRFWCVLTLALNLSDLTWYTWSDLQPAPRGVEIKQNGFFEFQFLFSPFKYCHLFVETAWYCPWIYILRSWCMHL